MEQQASSDKYYWYRDKLIQIVYKANFGLFTRETFHDIRR